MAYDNKHKALLQQIIEKGVMLNEEAQRLTVKLFDNDNVLLFANVLNSKLQTLNMEVKSVTCELSGDKYWMLSSTVQYDVAKCQTEFSPGELQLLRKIFTIIIESDTGSVSSINCLNLCSSLKSELSISNAQDFLTKMVELKYLFLKDGIFFMGVRSIGELMPYFRAYYEQDTFHTCFLCKQVIFHRILAACIIQRNVPIVSNRCQSVTHQIKI
ncbi:uncharacterized protein LOC107272642 isoform X2 [Cephus cinctus]|uniref:Non-structural maintenance of chromosomes element 1 homolog n=1 Tax=Cephus cinctus TaxID=211228 RepID=A0AAJ7C9U3_CEPCN|nr:uncharacterized protein LOC107272642 isoform X2 [Cephus cinctus]